VHELFTLSTGDSVHVLGELGVKVPVPPLAVNVTVPVGAVT